MHLQQNVGSWLVLILIFSFIKLIN